MGWTQYDSESCMDWVPPGHTSLSGCVKLKIVCVCVCVCVCIHFLPTTVPNETHSSGRFNPRSSIYFNPSSCGCVAKNFKNGTSVNTGPRVLNFVCRHIMSVSDMDRVSPGYNSSGCVRIKIICTCLRVCAYPLYYPSTIPNEIHFSWYIITSMIPHRGWFLSQKHWVTCLHHSLRA